VPYKCSNCNKETTITTFHATKDEVRTVTDLARRNLLKSDYEVVQVPTEVDICNYCGFRGEFEEVLERPEPEVSEEEPFDRVKHYKNWLSWIAQLKEKFGENKDEETGT
jgi:DNA-directed RNA polymerase subunit RPC12/RpoP